MRVSNTALTGEYRDYPLKRGVPYAPARTNRLKRVLAQIWVVGQFEIPAVRPSE
jgi:hypothetical protein